MAQKKSPVFEYVNAVTLTKDTSGLSDPSFEKNYVPFIVNRALDRKSTRLNSSHMSESRMPSSA